MSNAYVPTAVIRAQREAAGGPYGWCYLIQNLINGKGYVGQTVNDPRRRLYVLRSSAFMSKPKMRVVPLVTQDIRKHGAEAFVLKETWPAKDAADLNRLEREKIEECKTQVPHGYNIEAGGRSGKRSRDFCVAQSYLLRDGRTKKSPEWKAAMAVTMRKRAERERAARREAGILTASEMKDRMKYDPFVQVQVLAANAQDLKVSMLTKLSPSRGACGRVRNFLMTRAVGSGWQGKLYGVDHLRRKHEVDRSRRAECGDAPSKFREMWVRMLRAAIDKGRHAGRSATGRVHSHSRARKTDLRGSCIKHPTEILLIRARDGGRRTVCPACHREGWCRRKDRYTGRYDSSIRRALLYKTLRPGRAVLGRCAGWILSA